MCSVTRVVYSLLMSNLPAELEIARSPKLPRRQPLTNEAAPERRIHCANPSLTGHAEPGLWDVDRDTQSRTRRRAFAATATGSPGPIPDPIALCRSLRIENDIVVAPAALDVA